MNRISLLLFCLLSFSLNIRLNAQTPPAEKIYLKDGTVVEGNIIEQAPNRYIKVLRKNAGDTVEIKYSQIERFTRMLPDSTLLNYNPSTGCKSKFFGRAYTGLAFDEDFRNQSLTFGAEGFVFIQKRISVGISTYYAYDISDFGDNYIGLLGKIAVHPVLRPKLQLQLGLALGRAIEITDGATDKRSNRLITSPFIAVDYKIGKKIWLYAGTSYILSTLAEITNDPRDEIYRVRRSDFIPFHIGLRF